MSNTIRCVGSKFKMFTSDRLVLFCAPDTGDAGNPSALATPVILVYKEPLSSCVICDFTTIWQRQGKTVRKAKARNLPVSTTRFRIKKMQTLHPN